MSISTIPRQTVKLLAANEVGHNDLDTICNCRGQRYFQKAQCDDVSPFQVSLTEIGDELVPDGTFSSKIASGAATAGSGNPLIDAGGDFLDDGVDQQMLITDDTDSTPSDWAYADGTITSTDIDLTGNSVASGNTYSIYRWKRKSGVWTGTNHFVISGGVLSKVGKTASAAVFDEMELIVDRLYKIQITLANVDKDAPVVVIRVKLGGATVAVLTPFDGTYTFYFFLDAKVNNEIEIEGGAAVAFDVTNISVKAVSTMGLVARNIDTLVRTFEEFDGSSVNYLGISTDGDGFGIENTGFAQVNWDWSNLESGGQCQNGCYEICTVDLSQSWNFVENGFFVGNTDWTAGIQWSFDVGTAIGNAGVIPSTEASRRLRQALTTVLTGGKKYTITLDVSNFVSGSIEVRLDSLVIGTLSSDGAKTLAIDLTGETDKSTLDFILSDTDGKMDIDNVFITEDNDSKDIGVCSEPFDLRTSHMCTTLLRWSNVTNSHGFNYEDFSFSHSLRVRGKIVNFRGEKPDKDTEFNSNGNIDISYARTLELDTLAVEEQPRYIHRALNIMIDHESLSIDGDSYISRDEEYEPVWRRSSLLAPINIGVLIKNQLLETNNC